MKIFLPLINLMLAVACVLTGCQSPKVRSPGESGVAQSTRNNCYSLLYQLLDDQKNVGLLRFIKREQDDVKTLVKKIAAHSATGAKVLEEFARHPSIPLDDIRLPPGEAATRAAIASTRTKELLGQTGDEFELTLLLTQAEALSYASHLAKVAGKNEPQPDRARALAGVRKDMENLYHEVFVLLLSKTKSSATNQSRTQKRG
jgi:hypothetical protein